MLKFNSYIDLHPVSDREEYDKVENRLTAYSIPTVDEVDNVMSFMYADTVLQILRGQGIYRGYEVNTYADNEIRNLERELYNPRGFEREQKVKKAKQVNYYRAINFRTLNPLFQKAIRLLAKAKGITIKAAQEILLPQLMK